MKKNLKGMIFGKLKVIEETDERSGRAIKWRCVCKCGNEVVVSSVNLLKGDTKSCGCIRIKDLSEQKFNRLKVLYRDEIRSGKKTYWKCLCDCGNIVSVRSDSLQNGHTKSCGCYCEENRVDMRVLKIENQKFDKITAIKPTTKRSPNGSIKWVCECDCGTVFLVDSNSLSSGNTRSCGCTKRSRGELIIENILLSNYINFKSEYKFSDFTSARYDFVIFDNSNNPIRIIEFDGKQHFVEVNSWMTENHNLQTRKLKDYEKNMYAIKNNIPIIRIPYWEIDNISFDMIFGDKFIVSSL